MAVELENIYLVCTVQLFGVPLVPGERANVAIINTWSAPAQIWKAHQLLRFVHGNYCCGLVLRTWKICAIISAHCVPKLRMPRCSRDSINSTCGKKKCCVWGNSGTADFKLKSFNFIQKCEAQALSNYHQICLKCVYTFPLLYTKQKQVCIWTAVGSSMI